MKKLEKIFKTEVKTITCVNVTSSKGDYLRISQTNYPKAIGSFSRCDLFYIDELPDILEKPIQIPLNKTKYKTKSGLIKAIKSMTF